MLNNLTIQQAHKGLIKKQFSCTELILDCLEQIKKSEPKIKALLLVLPREELITQAETVDKKIARNESLHPLEGIPAIIKDNIAIAGTKTTAASRILENYIAPYDATTIKKLKQSGVIFLGKANLDEFACGSSTESSAYQVTKNPHDPTRVPGGSSGGSAAAVAANECLFALGSDTAGSIRQPAAFCGVVGLKPTYGRVSRSGLIAMGSSLDVIGPITRSVADAAAVLEAIAGHNPLDATTSPEPVPHYSQFLNQNQDVKNLKIGLPREYFIDGIDAEIRQKINTAIKTLTQMGSEIVEISLPHTKYALPAYYIIMPSELSSNLARYDGIKYGLSSSKNANSLLDVYLNTRYDGFGPELKRRIMLGTYTLSAGYYDAYYKKANKVRDLIKQDFIDAFTKVDIIATPTAPNIAFKIGEKTQDPVQMYLSDVFTASANLAGIPGISVPCGTVTRNGKNLPVGIQFLGKHFDEATVLKVAHQYEINK